MKRLIAIALFLLAGCSYAQGTCSSTNPCVQLTITNPNTLPSTAVLLSCSGGSCTAASLQSYLQTQTATNLCPQVQTIWKCTSFSQTKTPQLYNDPEAWGTLINYAVQGVSGGGVSAASSIIQFPVPSAPAQPPSITGLPTMVTSGTSGPQ